MPAISNAEKIWQLLTMSMPALRRTFQQAPSHLPELNTEPILIFLPFETVHSQKAAKIQSLLDAIIAQPGSPATSLANALSFFESLIGKDNPDLLFYGFRLFLTRYKGTETFTIPSLSTREAERITPTSAATDAGLPVAVGSSDETKLDWFRESPCLNEHHEHWHLVYDTQTVIDRQGEMFFYMHQQMLARYDAERQAAGVPFVQAFDDFSKPIAVGYQPGPDERLASAIPGFRRREANELLSVQVSNRQRAFLNAIQSDIDAGHYDAAGNQLADETRSANRLGSTIESNVHPDADTSKSYIGYHGWGHVRIHEVNRGVMGFTVFAVREVVFWEWHKGIDNLNFRLQERRAPYQFLSDAPPVLLRKGIDDEDRPYSMDMILVSGEDTPTLEEGASVGEAAFGGAKWNDDFEEGSVPYHYHGTTRTIRTTRTFNTQVKIGLIQYRDEAGEEQHYSYDFLVHDPFGFFFRVENTSLEIKRVSIRIFMVPSEIAGDRRKWIELDKFFHELAPLSKTVVFRRDLQSSVVAKPAVIDPTTHHTQFDPTSIPLENACDCGWPYQLLLPKGSSSGEGMEFTVMVMISDGALDEIDGDQNCGSLSFCAARADAYPDRRPLGYPFNRKFSQSIADTIRSHDHMASRTVFIKTS